MSLHHGDRGHHHHHHHHHGHHHDHYNERDPARVIAPTARMDGLSHGHHHHDHDYHHHSNNNAQLLDEPMAIIVHQPLGDALEKQARPAQPSHQHSFGADTTAATVTGPTAHGTPWHLRGYAAPPPSPPQQQGWHRLGASSSYRLLSRPNGG